MTSLFSAPSGWQLVQSDDFNGSAVDTTKWSVYGPWIPGHGGKRRLPPLPGQNAAGAGNGGIGAGQQFFKVIGLAAEAIQPIRFFRGDNPVFRSILIE